MPAGASFQLMVESTFSPFVLVDASGYVTWIGPKIEELLGAPPEHYIGHHLLDSVAPEFHEIAISAFEDYIDEAVPIDRWSGPPMDVELIATDGSRVPCEISAAVGSQYGYDGLILQVRRSQGTTRLYDAVDAMAIGAPIHDVLGRLAALCEHDMPGSSVTIAWDWDGHRFLNAAPELDHPVSVTEPEPKLTPWRGAMETGEVQGGGDLAADHPDLALAVEGSGFSACWCIPITVRGDRTPDAAIVLWRADPGGATPHHQTIPQRVSRLAALALQSDRHHAQLHTAATTDDLTGLRNRAEQRGALREMLDRIDLQPSVLFCDLDDFKPVNERYGHDFGDRVLRIVARRLEETLRSNARVARWGGDEFIVVCESASTDQVQALARRLIDTVSEPITIDRHEHHMEMHVHVGMSVGVAHPRVDSDADDMIRRADDAMRAAKAAGKNRCRVAD